MTRIYLVRHAHADWTPDEARPLSPKGRHDAVRVADLLAPLGVRALYSSPSRRAIETLEPLARRARLDIVRLDDLRERELPVQPPAEFQSAVRASWRDPERAVGSGEANLAAQARGVRAVRALVARHPDEGVVVATHGNLLALVLNALDPTFAYDFWQGLTSPDVYALDFRATVLERVRRVWTAADTGPG